MSDLLLRSDVAGISALAAYIYYYAGIASPVNYMRATVDDILHHIAEDLRCYSGADKKAAAEEFVLGYRYDLHISITTDLEETELDYLERYGRGHTFYFRLADFEHGKLLAGQMYWIMLGVRPDMDAHTGDRFSPDDKLYLFLHVSNIEPPPVGATLTA